MGVGIVAAVVTVAAAGASAYSGYKQGKANEKNVKANNAAAAENHAIQVGYHKKLKVHQANLEEYATKQQDFAFEKKAYGELAHKLAVTDRNKQVDYLNEQSYNEKLAAKTEYSAEKMVASILQNGAVAQANSVINDTLRVAGANKRAINVQSEKMMGTIVATSQAGIAQGASKDRMVVEAFLQRNAAIADVGDKAKAGILATVNAKDKVVNDTNLRLAESYRGLAAIMRSRPQPVGVIPPPSPVFTEREPTMPLAPVGAAPVQMATAGNAALIAGAVGTVGGAVSGMYTSGAFKGLLPS